MLLHLGLVSLAVSAFLPWATIGGRDHDGFATANVLLTLSRDGLPAEVGWVASTWYAGAFLAVIGWAAVTLLARWEVAVAAALAFALAAVAMVGFAWVVGSHGGVTTGSFGPALALVALVVLTCGSMATAVVRSRVAHPVGPSPGSGAPGGAPRRGADSVRHTSG